MGLFEKLLIIAIIIFVAGYMGYLGPSIQQKTHNIVNSILKGSSSSENTASIKLIAPEPSEPILIDAQYTGDVILPINVVMKIPPGDIVTISLNKFLNSQFGLTNWKIEAISNFHLWVSQSTLEEAKKYGIKINVYLSGNTRIGFEIIAPQSYPDNKTPTFTFIGAIGFHVDGLNLKRLILGGTDKRKLVFVVRDVNSGATTKIPVEVAEGSVQGILSSKNTDIQIWLKKENMVMIWSGMNNGW